MKQLPQEAQDSQNRVDGLLSFLSLLRQSRFPSLPSVQALKTDEIRIGPPKQFLQEVAERAEVVEQKITK